MFGLSLAEVTVIAVVALILLGPDKLPTVMRLVARGYTQLARIKLEFSKAMETNLAPLAPLDPKNWTNDLKKIVPEYAELNKLSDQVKDITTTTQNALRPKTSSDLATETDSQVSAKANFPINLQNNHPAISQELTK
jgi:Sec-independent protein translocase protein TatA